MPPGAARTPWLAAVLVVLGRAGLQGDKRGTRLRRWGTWFLVAVSMLAALLNFASQSRWENAIFGPLSVLLTILCAIVARSPLADERAMPPARIPTA